MKTDRKTYANNTQLLVGLDHKHQHFLFLTQTLNSVNTSNPPLSRDTKHTRILPLQSLKIPLS